MVGGVTTPLKNDGLRQLGPDEMWDLSIEMWMCWGVNHR